MGGKCRSEGQQPTGLTGPSFPAEETAREPWGLFVVLT